MGQDYDRLLRENITELFPSLSKTYLGIEIAQSEVLDDKLQQTVVREADFVQKVITTTGETLIVHLEFQSSNDATMLQRMQMYHALLSQDYDLPIRQFVIYVGAKPANMDGRLDPAKVFTGYELIDVQQFDTQALLHAHLPEEVLLAILSDFKTEEAPQVVPQIIQRLKELSTNKATLEKYTYQLLILARLRNLNDITQQIINDMAFTYDIEKDALYKKGLEKGEKRGEEKGKTEGKLEEKIEVAVRMKKAGLAISDIKKFTGLSAEQIDNLPIDL